MKSILQFPDQTASGVGLDRIGTRRVAMIQILGIGMKEAECQAIAIVGMKRKYNDDSPDQDSLQAV